VASCDADGRLASPLATVQRGTGDLRKIAALARADGAIEIIVGLPVSLSGREGAAAVGAREFAARLARQVAPVPVRLVDERFTTVIAHDALREGGSDARRRRPKVDQAAAALLLQGALDLERSTGRPAGELVGSTSGGDG
jgi:putative Holliday junction resolvase